MTLELSQVFIGSSSDQQWCKYDTQMDALIVAPFLTKCYDVHHGGSEGAHGVKQNLLCWNIWDEASTVDKKKENDHGNCVIQIFIIPAC